RTLKDIALSSRYELRLITIRREFQEIIDGETTITEHIIGLPQMDTEIQETDTLVVFGPFKAVKKFLDINA
ncbi:MAG: TrkA C-terminal domain-containing protein, partial [Flavobacteriales bacterium]